MSNDASLFTRVTPQPPLFFQCMPKASHLVSFLRGSKIFLSSALMALLLVLSIVLSMMEPGWTMPRLPVRPSEPLKGMNLNAVAWVQLLSSVSMQSGSMLIFNVLMSSRFGLIMISLHVS